MQSSIGTSLNVRALGSANGELLNLYFDLSIPEIFRLIHPGLLGTLGKNMFNANLGDWQPERKVR
ncbi:uncharacterized protein PHALS_04814 [Plasmopara halstedii]|uniref:Uncharacterized protein n=1 Tax=Plasmopara halstedii TaxID=4781 RepID=A0A0P1B0K5_PLAHL|nr:uncharacterized protein PHALS_04814 [Plasmopara halstedii]CEG47666.1 hypothetical protein PHALS_04814 [Plasmopara halstedii]|eukprot:XP_024584035.1 hypothetical protein PHALS_04814 [Plasmopara halstedii]